MVLGVRLKKVEHAVPLALYARFQAIRQVPMRFTVWHGLLFVLFCFAEGLVNSDCNGIPQKSFLKFSEFVGANPSKFLRTSRKHPVLLSRHQFLH